jgi:hypothetical protein
MAIHTSNSRARHPARPRSHAAWRRQRALRLNPALSAAFAPSEQATPPKVGMAFALGQA